MTWYVIEYTLYNGQVKRDEFVKPWKLEEVIKEYKANENIIELLVWEVTDREIDHWTRDN